ncbi:MAG: hypothetical protein ACOYX5_10340 [Actinomycetota bacterium]
MDFREFRRLRAGLIINLPAARGEILESAATRLRNRLQASAMFADVEVEATEDEDQLLISMLKYRPGTPARQVTSFLEAIWVTTLRLPGLDAFSFLVEDGHVELESVTGDREARYFITLHLIAQEGTEEDFARRPTVPEESTLPDPLPIPDPLETEPGRRKKERRRLWLRS